MTLRTRLQTTVLAIALGAVVGGCDFAGLNEAINDFKLVIGLEKIDTPVSVRFVDASTGQLIDQPVELSFAGVHQSSVVDLYNDPIRGGKATFNGGVGSFGIANGVEPIDEQPVILRLTARASGYAPRVQNIHLTSIGRHSVVVQMLGADDAPPGGAAVRIERGETNASGEVQESFDVTTPPVSGVGGATLYVDAGTILRTVDGAPLSGRLTTNVSYAGADALALLPGGARAELDSATEVAMASLGFARVEIVDQEGREVKTFSRPVQVEFALDPTSVHPQTNAPLSESDHLAVFSFDDDEGHWRQEGEAAIRFRNGIPYAHFELSHLSTWSLGAIGTSCLGYFTIDTNGHTVTTVNSSSRFYSESFSVPASKQRSHLVVAPFLVMNDQPISYEINGSIRYVGASEGTCGMASIQLPLAENQFTVTLRNVETPCPSGQRLKAGYEGAYGIEIADVVAGTPDWFAAQSSSVDVVTEGPALIGTAEASVRPGTSYRVQGSFNEKQITGSFVAPAGVGDGDVLEVEIHNEITADMVADACE